MNLKRLYHTIRISMMRNGYKRAEYLKKKKFLQKWAKIVLILPAIYRKKQN